MGSAQRLACLGEPAHPPAIEYGQSTPDPTAVTAASSPAAIPLDLTDFKRDLSELTDRLGNAQDCL